MKISNLIIRLQSIKKKLGDLEILIADKNGSFNNNYDKPKDIEFIEIFENEFEDNVKAILMSVEKKEEDESESESNEKDESQDILGWDNIEYNY